MTTEIVIQASDVEDVRFVLKAALTFIQARDLMESQIQLQSVRPSPLAQELERIIARQDSYFAQYLIERHEAALYGEDDSQVEEDEPVDPEASQELPEGDLDPLPDAPFGAKEFPKQKGRRVSAKELQAREIESEDEDLVGDDQFGL